MKALFLSVLSLSFAYSAFARDCNVNYAKYAAIRAYKAEMGVVQGSEGLQYEGMQTYAKGTISKYNVVIADNNEDGETWELTYKVTLRQNGLQCQILEVITQ